MKYKHFTVEEREKIQVMLWQKSSIRTIATALNRSPSSVSREINRNKDILGRRFYVPRTANERALEKRKSRGRKDRLKNSVVREYVIKRLKDDGWSPEQIAGKLSEERPGNHISHETIYQYIYAQVHRNGWGELRPGHEDLRYCLKRRHKRRQKKGMRSSKKVPRFSGYSIEKRPFVVNSRTRIGDWETDSIASINNQAGLNSLTERKSGLILLTKLKDKTAKATKRSLLKESPGFLLIL